MTDTIKAITVAALNALRVKNICIVVLRGVKKISANPTAKKLGITKVEADVLTDRTADIVAKLVVEGGIVAMAADGVNDALALSAADVAWPWALILTS